MGLDDRVYIVTGGSKGFGLAIAKGLVEKGARVGLLSRGRAELDLAVTELGSDSACGVLGDVANSTDLSRAFNEIARYFGRLDGLVNNAGMARPNKIENLVEEEVLMQVNTNFLGTVYACQAAIPLLRESGSDNPRIVNISSASALHFDEMCHLSVYAASKAAVERFTRDLATECQLDEIGVTCIRPGAADSNIADGWDMKTIMAAFEAWREEGNYLREGMSVAEIAGAVAYALSQPRGMSVDLLELRPQRRAPKN